MWFKAHGSSVGLSKLGRLGKLGRNFNLEKHRIIQVPTSTTKIKMKKKK